MKNEKIRIYREVQRQFDIEDAMNWGGDVLGEHIADQMEESFWIEAAERYRDGFDSTISEYDQMTRVIDELYKEGR